MYMSVGPSSRTSRLIGWGSLRQDGSGNERSQVPPARLSGRATGPPGTAREARRPPGTAGARQAPPARVGAEDAEPDGLPRSLPLRALRQPPGAASAIGRPLLALRSRPAQLHQLHVVRHQRALGVHADVDGARGAEGWTERVQLL